MDAHGFSLFAETEACMEGSDKIVQGLVPVGSAYKEYVYYRTRDGWGLPYLFVFAKV